MVKVALVGNASVGKTCIIKRYISTSFDEGSKSTETASFQTKSIVSEDCNNEIQIRLWDTAGQEVYRSLISFYYKDADAIFLVYDVTNKKSFEDLEYWLKEIKEKGPKDCLLTIIGNKCDSIDNMTVDQEISEDFAQKNGAGFFLTSAKEDINIKNAFMNIAIRAHPKLKTIFKYDNAHNGKENSTSIKKKINTQLRTDDSKGCGGICGCN